MKKKDLALELFFTIAHPYCSLQKEKKIDGKCYLTIGNNRSEITPKEFDLLMSLYDKEN